MKCCQRVAMCLRWCCLKNAWHRIKCHSFFPSLLTKQDEEDVKNFSMLSQEKYIRAYAKHNSWNMHNMSWPFFSLFLVFKLLLDEFSGCFGSRQVQFCFLLRWRWTNYTNSFTNTWRLYSLNVCEKCERNTWNGREREGILLLSLLCLCVCDFHVWQKGEHDAAHGCTQCKAKDESHLDNNLIVKCAHKKPTAPSFDESVFFMLDTNI